MIQFFRKIRQNLLSENRYSKYFMYALGEILLVVLGILIALAINNKNQDRIDSKKEQAYLNGLLSEFETSKYKLNELITFNNKNFEGSKQIVSFIAEHTELPSENDFSILLYTTFAYDITFNPNNSLLNEMINSGGLKNISNPKLRVRLTNWVSFLEDIAKQESDLRMQREKVLNMFRNDQNSIRTIFNFTGVSKEMGLAEVKTSNSNLSLLNSMKFENNVLMFMLTSYATETTHYKPLMEEIDLIIELITAELEI